MGLSPPIVSDNLSLSENNSNNVRSAVSVNWQNIRTNKIWFCDCSTIGAILWNDLPAELKNVESFNIFKQTI